MLSAFLAAHARWVLVAGLALGIAFPAWAAVLTPWLRVLVAVILGLTAFRIGPALMAGFRASALGEMRLVLVLQLGLPLAVVGLAAVLGARAQPLVLALALMLAAPPIMSAPALCQMMGTAGDRAMRLLVLGSAALPVTVVPVLWLLFGGGRFGDVLLAAAMLALLIGGAICGGLVARRLAGDLSSLQTQRVDALGAVLLAVFVIALMPAVAQTWAESPARLLVWLGAACAANFGLQWLGLRLSGSVDVGVACGNRNMSLFLAALPPEVIGPALAFLGCYQIPMFLTPLVMAKLYQKER